VTLVNEYQLSRRKCGEGGEKEGKGESESQRRCSFQDLEYQGLVELETVASGQRHSPKKNELEESGV